jgi:hypothetical protein
METGSLEIVAFAGLTFRHVAQSRKSRKRRRPPRPAQPSNGNRTPAPPPSGGNRTPAPPPSGGAPSGGAYARGRAKDEAARAALKPLRPGERPAAVTAGAIAAGALALANLIAMIAGYNPSEDTLSPGNRLTGGIVTTLLLALVAYGMWRARYWAVLGMQTLLALTIIFCALALVQAINWWAFVLVSLILIAAGTLFWFLVKAMARIQMPERPGSS